MGLAYVKIGYKFGKLNFGEEWKVIIKNVGLTFLLRARKVLERIA